MSRGPFNNYVDKGIERLVGKNLKDIHPSLIITQGCRKVKIFSFFGGGGGGSSKGWAESDPPGWNRVN